MGRADPDRGRGGSVVGLVVALASALLGVVLLSGCYDPDLPDCTISCVGPDDCADGQVCTGDGVCAAPSASCGPGPGPASLTIRIEKAGRVEVIAPAFTCDSDDERKTCTTAVPRAGTLELRAVRTDKEFERWTSSTCAGQPATCHLTLGDDAIDVAARFR